MNGQKTGPGVRITTPILESGCVVLNGVVIRRQVSTREQAEHLDIGREETERSRDALSAANTSAVALDVDAAEPA